MPTYIQNMRFSVYIARRNPQGAGGVWGQGNEQNILGLRQVLAHWRLQNSDLNLYFFALCTTYHKNLIYFYTFRDVYDKVISRKTNVQAYTQLFWCGPVSNLLKLSGLLVSLSVLASLYIFCFLLFLISIFHARVLSTTKDLLILDILLFF